MSLDPRHFKPLRAIGLMSGTSMDGVDAAYIETDGENELSFGPSITQPYEPVFRAKLGRFIASAPERFGAPDEMELEAELTDLHQRAVATLLTKMNCASAEVDLVGFHGQTIWHRPNQNKTWQMGDGERLAASIGIPVAFDFRSADVAAGGQGAPLAPVFHSALAQRIETPAVVANIGGVANITWISPPSDLIAFDTGPGCGLIDDWVRRRCGMPMDENGELAASGTPDMDIVAQMTASPFFNAPPPKSLDRFDFGLDPILSLKVEDGAATLVALTADCIHRGLQHCPVPPKALLVTGGGRHNPTLMLALAQQTGLPLKPVEDLGWNGDAIEAQAFAYMAVRCLKGLPITFPGTTGVAEPLTGGRIVRG
jgi:anhydro-N-acetylmuramic acid kinase